MSDGPRWQYPFPVGADLPADQLASMQAERDRELEDYLDQLRTIAETGGGTGTTDHHLLTNLGVGDDHPQYLRPIEVLAGANVTIDTTTTPGSVIIASTGGSGGGTGFVYNQGVAASVWTITHNLGFYPNATVIDSGGATVEGDTTQLSVNQLRLNFSGAFAGTAYLS